MHLLISLIRHQVEEFLTGNNYCIQEITPFLNFAFDIWIVFCRLSSDLYTIDDALPFILNILLANFVGLLGIAIVLSYVQVLPQDPCSEIDFGICGYRTFLFSCPQNQTLACNNYCIGADHVLASVIAVLVYLQ